MKIRDERKLRSLARTLAKDLGRPYPQILKECHRQYWKVKNAG